MTDYVTGGPEGAVAVRQAVRARVGPPAAWWGMLILIASESMLFAAFVATYFYLRFTSPAWPQGGVDPPKVLVPVVLVACLVATCIPMRAAWLAARAGRVAAARLFLVCALVVQCGYFAYEVHDFSDQLDKTPVTHNAYTSIYYTLLGADHAHVALGILFNLWLLGKLVRGLTTYRANATQAIALYWYAVSVITIVVIATLLSARG